MIAVVTHSLSAPSETFVRRHIREIAPRRTVVVFFEEGAGPKGLDCPMHRVHLPNRSARPWVARKASGLWTLLRHGAPTALSRSEHDGLLRFFSEYNVTTVLAEFGTIGCLMRPVCDDSAVRLFVHFHGVDASAWARKCYIRYAYRCQLSDVAGIICPSRFLATRLAAMGLPEQNIHVVPYGVDPGQFHVGESRHGIRLLAVGRFVEKKAPFHTLEAFARVADKHPSVFLDMIGEGPLLRDCRSLARRLRVEKQVVFHGARSHDFVQRKMSEACVFVQHSVTARNGDTEGLPVAILEAMSSALPVVSTRHAGIPEAVVDGETGYLVEEHDDEGMTQAMETLVSDPTLREMMGKAGRTRAVKHFSARKQIRRLREILGLLNADCGR